MTHGASQHDVSFVGPAEYRIVVEGYLDEDESERLAGMQIRSIESENGTSRTTLAGWIVDQAELLGVLNAIYEMHLPIRDVEALSGGPVDSYPRRQERD